MLATIATAFLLTLPQERAVSFSYRPTLKVETIHVVGQFNNWDKTTHPLQLDPDGKTWKGKFMIAPGVYQYLFVENGNKWLPDPNAPRAGDANGNTNSLLIVEPIDYDRFPRKAGDGLITESALLHRPDRRDTVRLDSGRFAVWLRTRAGDIELIEIVSDQAPVPMTKERSDELYDYWRGEMPGLQPYTFRIVDGSRSYSYPKNGERFKQDASSYPLPKPPAWVQDAIFYQIFPDRFKNGTPANDPKDVAPWGAKPTGRNWMGGDLQGIRDGMPHLLELGITALYLNPVFVSPSNHGYDTFDYETVNPRLGSNEDLRALVDAAHGRGWKVMLDGVFNHSGIEFPPFKDLREKGADSKFKDWFHVKKLPLEVRDGQQTYGTFAGVTSMPKLNTDNPEVRAFVNRIGTKWIREDGIDGWRLDVADEVSHGMWREFRKAVKAEEPDAYILGEVWGDAHEWLQGDEHDGVMNYRWRKAVLDFLAYRTLKPSSFDAALKRIREDYPSAVLNSMFNLLGSHDTERLATIFKGDKARQMLAVALQFTYPGAPCIYYGDEIGMEGGKDPDDRRAMIWDRSLWDTKLFDLYKALIDLRKTNEPLRRGTYRTRMADDATGLFVFERTHQRKTTEVILNTSDQPVRYVRGGKYQTLFARGAEGTDGQFKLEPFGFTIVSRMVP
ncbi:MAG: alpha amylase N-terminal ig-like domain-containing protein [Fimbriimonas sp.]